MRAASDRGAARREPGARRRVDPAVRPDGPKAGWAEADLVLMAVGGPLFLTGDEDRPPVRLPVPQAWCHAAAEAAAGAMAAHHERQRSAAGSVDVSAQQDRLATQSTSCAAVRAPQVRRWPAASSTAAPAAASSIRARRYVAITFLFGSAIAPSRRMMEYVHGEGPATPPRDKD
jgi:hypothetical protein